MEEKTTASEVIDSFESSFADKREIPESLEMVWLKKSIGRYSVELGQLNFDEDTSEFDTKLDRYIIDTIAQFMCQLYQERQVSLVNKRVSIVGKDVSLDGNGNVKTAEREHLEYMRSKSSKMADNQKPSAYV